jgi:hypothetical protein
MQRSDGDQSNPWTLIQRRDSFDCPYYTVRSDTVTFLGRETLSYYPIHMKNSASPLFPSIMKVQRRSLANTDMSLIASRGKSLEVAASATCRL